MGVDATIDITPEERRTVLALLQRHLPGTAAWVYGSRAKWTSTPTSDLDLVVFATPEQQPQVGDLREALEESDLPFRVDRFVWDDVPESFRQRIEADKAPLVGQEAGDGRTAQVAATGRRDPDGWCQVAVAGITGRDLSGLEIPAPPLSEQRAIAHVLGTLDDKIELNRRMNATLEAMARALFRSWFVDFDPVRAKMEGRATGLPKEIADLFPDRLVNSAVGEIPAGWPLVPLPELMDVNPSRPLRKGDVAPYLDMANMPTLGHAPDSVVRRPFGSGMRFANGDTLMARITPCLENGKTAYVDFLRDNEIGWGSTEYIVMKPRRPLPSEFAYLLARTARFREFAIRNMSGTSGRQRVSASSLSGFSMPSPPAAIGVEFGCAVQLLLGRAKAAVDECYVLANCRDTLLPKLISGEMRVGDAERLVGGTA